MQYKMFVAIISIIVVLVVSLLIFNRVNEDTPKSASRGIHDIGIVNTQGDEHQKENFVDIRFGGIEQEHDRDTAELMTSNVINL